MAETVEAWKARMGIGTRTATARLHGGPGTAQSALVPRDDAPGIAGRTTEHWDGRRDAVATAPTVTPTPLGVAALAAQHARMTKETT